MEEKVLDLKQNGMAMLILDIVLWILPIGLIILAEMTHISLLLVLSIVVMVISYICATLILPGLKVLKPQEALVLTFRTDKFSLYTIAGFKNVTAPSTNNPVNITRKPVVNTSAK